MSKKSQISKKVRQIFLQGCGYLKPQQNICERVIRYFFIDQNNVTARVYLILYLPFRISLRIESTFISRVTLRPAREFRRILLQSQYIMISPKTKAISNQFNQLLKNLNLILNKRFYYFLC